MKKILNYISITLVVLSVFSCQKNEWTSENEENFKKEFRETLKEKGNGMFTDDQASYVADCVLEKIKTKNLKPHDTETPGIVMMVRQMGQQCAQQALSKNRAKTTQNKLVSKDTEWTPQNEKQCIVMLKKMFANAGITDKNAAFLADCAINKIKEQKISPADLEDPKNRNLIQEIGKSCGQELMKKK